MELELEELELEEGEFELEEAGLCGALWLRSEQEKELVHWEAEETYGDHHGGRDVWVLLERDDSEVKTSHKSSYFFTKPTPPTVNLSPALRQCPNSARLCSCGSAPYRDLKVHLPYKADVSSSDVGIFLKFG